MRYILAACLALSLLLPAQGARAAPAGEYNGYLFQVKAGCARLFGLTEGIEPVVEEAGIYRAGSLEDIEGFAPAEELEYVEPDYLVTLLDSPDDPMYQKQWSLGAMGAEEAWDLGLDGSGVRIGIVDSGLDAGHEDLDGARILPGHDYLGGSEDTGDEVGHGTFVTGIIAAVPGNGIGVAGLAPGAEIVPIKCFNATKSEISKVITAIYAGVDDHECDILNLSFGVTSDSTTLKNAIEYAAGKDVILVAAVGNSGTGTLNYPAAYDQVIGVGSVDANKTVAKRSQRNGSVFVTAPGDQVLGLSLDRNSPYKTGSGTSYATPHVTAAVAILKQARPELDRDGIMQLLAGSAEDLGQPGYDTSYGHGFVSLPDLHLLPQPGADGYTVVKNGKQLASALDQRRYIRLGADITMDDVTTIDGTVALDLGGHTLRVASSLGAGSCALAFRPGAQASIQNGTIDCSTEGVWAAGVMGGRLELENVTINGPGALVCGGTQEKDGPACVGEVTAIRSCSLNARTLLEESGSSGEVLEGLLVRDGGSVGSVVNSQIAGGDVPVEASDAAQYRGLSVEGDGRVEEIRDSAITGGYESISLSGGSIAHLDNVTVRSTSDQEGACAISNCGSIGELTNCAIQTAAGGRAVAVCNGEGGTIRYLGDNRFTGDCSIRGPGDVQEIGSAGQWNDDRSVFRADCGWVLVKAAGRLPALDIPVDLFWGSADMEADGRPVPEGAAAWQMGALHQNQALLRIYRRLEDGSTQEVAHTLWRQDSGEGGRLIIDDTFLNKAEERLLESGTYFFTVQALGDYIHYEDSPEAVSPERIYTRPPPRVTIHQVVRDGSGSVSVLVSTDTAVTLVAASYSAGGRMLGIRLVPLEAGAAQQEVVFSLPLKEDGTIKVFAVDGDWQPAVGNALD